MHEKDENIKCLPNGIKDWNSWRCFSKKVQNWFNLREQRQQKPAKQRQIKGRINGK